MKNRLCRMSQTLLGAACLFATCGVTYSCSDEYDLEQSIPEWLGASIYDELKNRGNFTTMIRLIDDLDQSEVLAKTGSKTLFVADDDAFADFFKNSGFTTGTGEAVTSYDQLSTSQKRLLFNGCMLDNAYLLEMMPNLGSTDGISKNACLRQLTSAASTDSIRIWAPSELPYSSNPDETDYWAYYNGRSGSGKNQNIIMATDNTVPMMTHFMLAHLNSNSITTDDISFILGLSDDDAWASGERRNYIYDVQIRSGRDSLNRYQSDVTCLNGYFNVLDRVMLTPSNMAEEIREYSETSYFSHMIDRFSAPFYDNTLRDEYNTLYGTTYDTLFVKRYFSSNSQGSELSTAPDGTTIDADAGILSYDPGWNEYTTSSGTAEQDMAAMFVPTNEAVKYFFRSGQGRIFMERYNGSIPEEGASDEEFLYALDQIPKNRLQPLINNLMKTSFMASVPSKYLSIMNDARDPMFSSYDETSYRALIDTCLLANNGVVYVINQLIAPATYSSVAGPALVSDQTQIMNAVITADDNYVLGSNYTNAPLKQYFSTYLKAMQSHFSLFLPTDDGLGFYGYVDPAIYSLRNYRRYWRFTYDGTQTSSSSMVLPITAVAYSFDPTTGQQEDDSQATGRPTSEASDLLTNSSGYGATKRYILIEMVNQHIIVHDDDYAEEYVAGPAEYYVSRSGAPVHIVDRTSEGDLDGIVQVEGGLQKMLRESSDYTGETPVCNVVETYDQTGTGSDGSEGYGNGMTYLIDRPMQPTMENVYSILSANDEYSDFFEQCSFYDEDLLDLAGVTDDASTSTEITNARNKYRIFETNEMSENVVRFFNNYRYTVYIPTNDAMQKAYDQGLPTWSEISDFVDANCDPELVTDETLLAENKAKAQAMITCLVNFLKYHFMDESVFYEKNIDTEATEYETSCVDNNNNIYVKINVTQQSSGDNILITDNAGVSHTVNPSVNNIFTRDNSTVERSGTSSSTAKYVSSTSYAVMHELNTSSDSNDDGFLYFLEEDELFSNGVKKDKPFVTWNTASEAKQFVKKYRIRK